jgi:hypothetical protein
MKIVRGRHLAFRGVILLCACSALAAPPPPRPRETTKPPSITSATTRRSSELPRAVYVLARLGPDLSDAYETGYLTALTRGIEALGATVRTTRLTGLEIDRSAAAKEREAFAPDVTFIVVFNDRFVSGSTHRGEVIVQLIDASGMELWRSRQTFVISDFLVPNPMIAGIGEKAGKAAIEKLAEDRVFPGPI